MNIPRKWTFKINRLNRKNVIRHEPQLEVPPRLLDFHLVWEIRDCWALGKKFLGIFTSFSSGCKKKIS